MNTSRKIFSGLIAIIVTIAVFLLGLSLAITNALGSAQPVKDALASSGIYEDFVGEAVDDIPGSIATIIKFEPEVRDVIVEAAIPSMKEDTEAGIDNLLAWLQGSTKEVTFTVEAADAQEPVAKAVGNYTQKMIEDLDECTSVPPNFNVNNPFLWGCKLPNTDAATYNTAFYEVVKDNKAFAQTTYTLDDILGMSEQELTEDYQAFTAIYPSAVATAWISAIVIVLGTIAVWFLSRSVRRTLRQTGIVFVIGGVLLIGAFAAGAVGMSIAAEEFGGNDPLEAVSADLIAGLGGVATAWLLWTGIIATVLGIVAIVASFFVGKGVKAPAVSSPASTMEAPNTPPQNNQGMGSSDTTQPPENPTPPNPIQ